MQLGPISDPSWLETFGRILSNQWWAAVILGLVIILHFLRDAALERRFSRLLESQTAATHAAAEADTAQAVALQKVAGRLGDLEKTVYRLGREVVTSGQDSSSS